MMTSAEQSLSPYQQKALEKALLQSPHRESRGDKSSPSLKWLLLRAFVIYQRHSTLPEAVLQRAQIRFQNRLRDRLAVDFQPQTKDNPQHESAQTVELPYYLFSFWQEVFGAQAAISLTPSVNAVLDPPKPAYLLAKQNQRSTYSQAWISLIRGYFAIANRNTKISRLKRSLGCISLIPITIAKRHIQVRGVCIHYHDLFHFEVAQLDRIRMGNAWVSGIHGIRKGVFHATDVPEEYDSFLDEARIAIHEALTRPSPFSIIKAGCWMLLLLLQGINPFAVCLRHWRTMQKKQQGAIDFFQLIPLKD